MPVYGLNKILSQIEDSQRTNAELQKKHKDTLNRYLLFKENIGCYESLDHEIKPLPPNILLNDSFEAKDVVTAQETLIKLDHQQAFIKQAISNIEIAIDDLESCITSMKTDILISESDIKILEKKYDSLYEAYIKYDPSYLKSETLPDIDPLPNDPSYQNLKARQRALDEKQKHLKTLCQSLEKAISDFREEEKALRSEIGNLIVKSKQLESQYKGNCNTSSFAVEKDDLDEINEKELPYSKLIPALEYYKKKLEKLENLKLKENYREEIIDKILEIACKNKLTEESYSNLYNEYIKRANELHICEQELIPKKEFALNSFDFLLDEKVSLDTLEKAIERLSNRQKELNDSYDMIVDAIETLDKKTDDLQVTVENVASENNLLKKEYDDLRKTYMQKTKLHPRYTTPTPLEILPAYNMKNYNSISYSILESELHRLLQEQKTIKRAVEVLRNANDQTTLNIQNAKKELKKIVYKGPISETTNSSSLDDFFEIELSEKQNKGSVLKIVGFATALFFIAIATSRKSS